MITFQHRNRSIHLEPGEIYRSHVEQSYTDVHESEVWQVVQRVQAGESWRKAVNDRFATTKPWLYRIITAENRARFFQLFPPGPEARVLDVGSGWGQIALPLAKLNKVTIIEPNPERIAFIRAAAAQDGVAMKMAFVQADFLDLEFPSGFDLVSCIGVLEWVPCFRSGIPRDVQIEFLRRANNALNRGGKLVVGIENRLGLKYLLGAPDDHLAVPHIGMLEYALARQRWQERTSSDLRVLTYSVGEYRELLAAAGFATCNFFAAYPDYKLPEFIIPADEPDQCAEFIRSQHAVPEHNGADGSDLPMLAEIQSVHRSLAEMGIAQYFAPSYFIVASK